MNKKHPSIFDLIEIMGARYQDMEKRPHPISIESPLEKQMEGLVGQLYNANVLKKIYMNHLHGHFFNEANFNIIGTFSPSKLRKADFIRALAKVYANKDLFERFFNTLPKHVKDIFCYFVWEGKEQEAQSLEMMFETKILRAEPIKGHFHGSILQKIQEDFLIFQIRNEFLWMGSLRDNYTLYLSIHDRLRKVFKNYLPFPKECDLIPVDSIEETEFIYENQEDILKHIKLYYSYVLQGNPKCSKHTDKILKSSLKQMAGYCYIKEFYDTKDKRLEYLATTLIIHFLQGAQCDIKMPPAELLKRLFQNFFQNKHPQGKGLYEFLYHLKGGYYEYNYEEREKRVKQSLLKLLKDLPSSKWVSSENMERYVLYRDMDLNVVAPGDYGNDLYFYPKYKRQFFSSQERTYIRREHYKDAVVIPFLRTMIFLFAAFGIVDITYDTPKNPIIQERDSDYLSSFDGLRYIRLTPLGEYIIGLTDRCPVAVEVDTARVLLDDKRLIIALEGKDPLRDLRNLDISLITFDILVNRKRV